MIYAAWFLAVLICAAIYETGEPTGFRDECR